jgi:cytosine/adenosine deaminase-related metal-dependent hydrolase
VSAPWVCPIVTPPIGEGALVLGGPGGDTVIACGRRADLRRDFPNLGEERAGGALLPGLVNAHTHLELSACAAAGPLAGGAGVIPWTRALMAARAARGSTTHSPSRHAQEGQARGDVGAGVDLLGTDGLIDGAIDDYAAAHAAAVSARRFGTVAIGDVGNGTVGWRALRALGFRGLFFHELVGSREAVTGDALADAALERRGAREKFRARSPSRPGAGGYGHEDRHGGSAEDSELGIDGDVPAVPAPHAPYSVGPALLRRIFAAAAASGHPTSIHLAEDAAELELLRHGRGAWTAILAAMGVPEGDRSPGLSPTAYLQRLGAFDTASPPLLVHMVHADDEDLRRAQAARATIVVCARSNLHIATRLADVPAMVAAGVRLALGTDSLASAADLSPWQELATLTRHFPDVPPRLWLHAATRGGALALGLGGPDDTTDLRGSPPGGMLGAFLPGARPGVLDVSLPASVTAYAPAALVERALVSSSTPTLTWICPA